jgi:hypothetical protein
MDAGFHVERQYAPFVEDGGSAPPPRRTQAGGLVRVTLRSRSPRSGGSSRSPIRCRPVSRRSSRGSRPRRATWRAGQQDRQDDARATRPRAGELVARGGFDHVERHDDRVQLFATRLSEGVHEFSYIARATTAGTFRTAPARARRCTSPRCSAARHGGDRGEAVTTGLARLRVARRRCRPAAWLAAGAAVVRSLGSGSGRCPTGLLDAPRDPSTLVVDRTACRPLRGAGGRRHPQHAARRPTLPPTLVAATLAAEDRRFWSHPGVDPIAIARAARKPRSGAWWRAAPRSRSRSPSCC